MKYAVTRNPKNHREVNEFMGKLNKKTYSGTGCYRGGNGKTWTQDYIHYPANGSKTQSNTMFGGYTLVSLEKLKEIMKPTKVQYRLIKTYPGSQAIGWITTDDMSAFKEYYEVVKPQVKVGDYVKWPSSADVYRILRDNGNTVTLQFCWGEFETHEYSRSLITINNEMGVTLASAEEIEKIEKQLAEINSKIVIAGREATVVGKEIRFGCNNFTLEDLQSYKKFLSYGNKSMNANGTNITVGILDRLIKKLKNGSI